MGRHSHPRLLADPLELKGSRGVRHPDRDEQQVKPKSGVGHQSDSSHSGWGIAASVGVLTQRVGSGEHPAHHDDCHELGYPSQRPDPLLLGSHRTNAQQSQDGEGKQPQAARERGYEEEATLRYDPRLPDWRAMLHRLSISLLEVRDRFSNRKERLLFAGWWGRH